MTKQKFGTKLSGRDRLTETCCAEKHWLLKTENQRKYACLRASLPIILGISSKNKIRH